MNCVLAILFFFIAVVIGLRGTPNAMTLAEAFVVFGTYTNLYLAFFNMIPIPPLDGSKVISWNFPVWFVFTAVLFVLLFV
jgi:Zn-dependent protease